MSVSDLFILLAIGLCAGFLSGLIGIGGGVVIVPLLVYIMSMNQKTAQGTTLFMFLFPIGILGVYNYHRAGHIDIKTAAIMAITFMLGSYLGSHTAINLETAWMKKVFAVAIILVGLKMLFGK